MNEALTIDLNRHWREFIAAKVEAGPYRSTEDVIRAALCLLEEEEERVARLAALLEEGEQSGGWEEWDYARFLDEVHADSADREAA